jgi:hypothetical protein
MITLLITLAVGLIFNAGAAIVVLASLLAFQWLDGLVTEIKAIKDWDEK